MAKERIEILSELYLKVVSERNIGAIVNVEPSVLEENNLHYQYLEAKGHIKVYPEQSDGTTAVGITVDGIDFYEDIKDIAADYWRQK
ncbi:hypothetical protein [Mesobacillus sp. S13]|uniref:hypothetical protein n=1 Tax=Mesobacillus sp. S13 TaxID=2880221 RepID=UPI001CF302D9|nr:hypothetical protein [Mesobacillus sp. S13]